MIGRVHSIQTLGTLDGPGLRVVVFMQGCALRCQYCHNPDSWNMQSGTSYLVGGLFQKILRYKPYFGEIGGLTVSGGEPLLQEPFVKSLFELCKANDISTALDTAGSVSKSSFSILEYTDTVILDIKATNQESFLQLAAGQLKNTENFLRKCLDLKKNIWIRHVIVPGLNNNEKSIEHLFDFLNNACAPVLPNLAYSQVTLLPYHTLGAYKWDELDIEYPLKNKPPASIEQVAELQKYLNELLS